MANITQKLVISLKPSAKDHFLRDDKLHGFGVKVTPKGKVSFFAEGRVKGGRTRRITLGSHPALPVSEARELAADKLKTMRQGTDPVVEERKQKAKDETFAKTLKSVFDEFINSRDLKPTTKLDYEGTFRLVFDDWGNKPIREITRQDVEKRFIEVREKRGLATAGKASRILSAICNFAMVDEIEGEPLLSSNPVDVIKQKKYKRVPRRRETHLTKKQIGKLYTFHRDAMDWPENPAHGVSKQGINFFLLIMATGLRRSEGLSLTWADVDFDEQVLTVRNTKNHTDHTVPLSDLTTTILQSQKTVAKESPWVFPAIRGGGHMTAPKSQLARIKTATGLSFTTHDLRRTFATHAYEAGAEYEDIRRALNHKAGGGVTAGYVSNSVNRMRDVFQKVADAYEDYYDPSWKQELEASRGLEKMLDGMTPEEREEFIENDNPPVQLGNHPMSNSTREADQG